MHPQDDWELSDWLEFIESVHPRTIDLSLDRVRRVLHCLVPTYPKVIITVGGTNGKGTTTAMLDAVYRSAGYRVGAYTSPHLVDYGERVKVAGEPSSAEQLCQAFQAVNTARGMIPLTYFEFGTLAAFELFSRARLDIWILEVGMGGRLDAVNAVDCDLALIASIDLDHQAWLGNSREAIGREKAGILRYRGRAIVSDPDPPRSIVNRLAALQCDCQFAEQDFAVKETQGKTFFSSGGKNWNRESFLERCEVKPNSLTQSRNLAGALAAIRSLEDRLPVGPEHVYALRGLKVRGRQERIDGKIPIWLDVGHNVEAVTALAGALRSESVPGKTRAVFAMLKDKEIGAAIEAMRPVIDYWYPAVLEDDRALTYEELRSVLSNSGITDPAEGGKPSACFEAALADSRPGDRLVVFGSFYLVGDILLSASEREGA
jgi:dihydrofolate synthase/folylpolyglutamate synthase